MGEKHSDESNVDGDEESVKSVAPVAEGTVTSGRGCGLVAMEEGCGTVSIPEKMQNLCSLLVDNSPSRTVMGGISSSNDVVDQWMPLRRSVAYAISAGYSEGAERETRETILHTRLHNESAS